jgi:PAS domain S-box-containing protein
MEPRQARLLLVGSGERLAAVGRVLSRCGLGVTSCDEASLDERLRDDDESVVIVDAASTGAALLTVRLAAQPVLTASCRTVVLLVERAGTGPWAGLREAGAQELVVSSADEAELASRVMALIIGSQRQSLSLAEERFRTIFHKCPDPCAINEPASLRFLDVNERFLAMTGLSREETIGRTGAELGLFPEAGHRAMSDAINERPALRDLELRSRRPHSGEPFDVLLSFEPVSLAGQPCLLSLGHDVTLRKQLEERLRQSQKMEAMGRLAGGVAHDFNNILTAIEIASSSLLGRPLLEDATRKGLEQILRSTQRAATLTRQLLQVAHKHPREPSLLDLNEIVLGMAKMLRRVIGEDLELHLALASQPCRVFADASEIEQILLNLATNARDAMARGGRLEIRTSVDHAQVKLLISDTGEGMNEVTRGRAFEPFFTTKPPGKGTGLGLATVYAIVQQSSGTITVESELGHGSSFEILLPHLESGEARPANAPRHIPGRNGSETVLLVEDDDDLRQLLRGVLEQSGYHVLTSGNGQAALEIALAQSIDLLLSDVVMPEISGLDLAARLHERRPGLRVLFMSGYPEDTIARYGRPFDRRLLLAKPFLPDDLLRRVREALDH